MGASKKESENFTQLPNFLFALLPSMKEAEMRVTMAMAREILGWHRKSAELSFSDLMELTGMGRQGVFNGISDGLKRGTIERKTKGQGFEYSLNLSEVVHEVDQSTKQTSPPKRPEVVHQVERSSPPSGTEVVHEVDQPIKEERKEINPKESLKKVGSARAPAHAKPLPVDFRVSETGLEYARHLCVEHHVDVDVGSETEQFKDHATAKGLRYVNWEAAWRNWMRNAIVKGWGAKSKNGGSGNGTVYQNGNGSVRESASARNAREYLESAELLARP